MQLERGMFMNNDLTKKETQDVCMKLEKEELNMDEHMGCRLHDQAMPLHERHFHEIPPHERENLALPPHVRGGLVSVLYDAEVMKNIYGDTYSFRMDQLARESPEMKILFALIMGFKIKVSESLVEALLYQRSMGVGIKFDNFTRSQLEILAGKLGVEAEILSVILNPIPEGIAVIIMSMIKEG